MNKYLSVGRLILARSSNSNKLSSSSSGLVNKLQSSGIHHNTLNFQHTEKNQKNANNYNKSNFFIPTRNLHLSPISNKSVEFNLADIGEGIAEVNVKEWYVKVGDEVKQFDKICEVQSDKATVTITSRYDGVITKLYYEVEDIAAVGKPLVTIESEDTEDSESSEKQTEIISDSLEQMPSPPATATAPSSSPEFVVSKVLATPSVRKLAMQQKVNITEVQGSGKDGRILKDDIVAFVNNGRKPADTSSSSPSSSFSSHYPPPLPPSMPIPAMSAPTKIAPKTTVTNLVSDRKEAIKGVRKAMVKTMDRANTIPHFSYCDEYDMTQLVNFKHGLKALGKERGVKISNLPFLIKACSLALHQYPILNAHVDEACDSITYKASHNIGFAVDTADGLVVPNIKNVEGKSIVDIAYDMSRLQALALANKLAPLDVTGGTFTISNIGSIGGTYMKPIILPPEVAIGALGRIQKLPRFDHDENVIVSNVMQVSWSADHRVIDGATMARFSNQVKKYIEQLNYLLMDLK